MNWFKRFIWWKCIFWFALGAAVSIVLPDVGAIGAKRISTEEFVSILAYPVLADGGHISAITVYPPRDHVEMLSLELEGKEPTAAYVYAQEPFVRTDHLKTYEQRVAVARAKKGIYLGDAASLAILRATERAAHMDAFRDWDSVEEFLTAMQAVHPQLRVQQAWWADRSLQRELSTAAGALVVGTLCSVLLAHRSKEEQAAYELMRTAANSAPLPSAPAAPSEEDLRRVRELDEALARNLAAGVEASTEADEEPAAAAKTAVAETAAPSIARLSDTPLEAVAEQSREEKDYAGDFYPTEVRAKPRTVPPSSPGRDRHGFSLIEMMVVIAILAIMMSILLPAMIRARQSADTIKCAANLHSIAQGMTMYLQANQNTFPAAYTYIGQQIVNGVQTPNGPAAGYVNWSSYLYGDGSVPKSAFTCPAMERGGLPPTNTTPDNMNPGQVCPGPGVVDLQAPRLAYTVNEALCPRNKFVTNFQSAQRTYRYVKANEVADSSITILATEMVDNGNMVSYGDNASGWIMSHRPIDGFCNSTSPDVYLLPIGAGFRPCTAADIDPEPLTETSSNSRLDLVGRNHGVRQSYPDNRLSNFAYVDGHVETKSIYDTVGPKQPFQWGAKFYSIVPTDDEQQ